MPRSCPRCQQAMQPADVPAVSGKDGDISVTLDSLPALICPQGHKRFSSAGFPATLLEALVDEAERHMKPCAESGLLFKRSVCAACREPLPAGGEATSARLTVALKDGPTLAVEVTAPTVSCSKCGTTQLGNAHVLDRGIPAALVRAFESAAIHAG